MDRRVVGQGLEDLVGFLKGVGVVARQERGTCRVEGLHGRIGDGRLRRDSIGIQRPGIVNGRGPPATAGCVMTTAGGTGCWMTTGWVTTTGPP